MSSKDLSSRLDSELSRVEMQLVEYGTSSISAVSVLASECLDSCTSVPLCLEYGVISEPAAPTVGVEQQPFQYVDWDNLEIDETLDDEGRIQVMNDDQLYVLLGLRDEERAKKSAHAAGANGSSNAAGADDSSNAAEAAGPRKNNKKNLPPEPSTPQRTTNEATIMQESPGMVTRR
uniref:Uncharacterized protein n=1 Tax=Oryza meridionalis TaxID=40149 RepID=A0A0E0EJ60_9ORYZ